jgi:hypothetical protein
METLKPHRTKTGADAKIDGGVAVASNDYHMICYNENYGNILADALASTTYGNYKNIVTQSMTVDGVWNNNWIYCTFTTRNYK